jgi:tetratricopeptide (TPR) repeat protein
VTAAGGSDATGDASVDAPTLVQPAGTTAAAADAGRTVLAGLDAATTSPLRASAVTRAWDAVESTLQTAAPPQPQTDPGPPRGQALVRALRQGDVVSLEQGHALLDLLAVAERARQSDYQVTDVDVEAARDALTRLRTASLSVLRLPFPPALPPSTGPAAAALPPHAADAAAPPLPPASPVRSAGHRIVARMVGAILLVVLALGGAAFVATHGGIAGSVLAPFLGSARARGIAAFDAGHEADARAQFLEAVRADSADPVPHLYLGRIAREAGDLTTARAQLTAAIQLAPGDAASHREMGIALLTADRADLARRFLTRAIALDPADHSAQGFLACALARLGRPGEARRFLDRAGSGPWTACASTANAAPAGPAATPVSPATPAP